MKKYKVNEPTFFHVPLKDITPNEKIIGPAPTPGMIRSVKSLGVFEPIILQFNVNSDRSFLTVISGGRRVKASRINELGTIPAMVYPMKYSGAQLIALHENEHRSQNLVAAYLAIKKLIDIGEDEASIAKMLEKPVSRVRDILRLDNLDSALLEALKTNQIKTTAAIKASKLSEDDQAELVEILEENGKIKSSDVKAVRSCSAIDIGETLPPSVFNTPNFGFKAKPKAIASVSADEIRQRCDEYMESHPHAKKTVQNLMKLLIG